MASLPEALRGDGLARAHKALVELEADAQKLRRSRGRLDHSPEPPISDRSGTVSRSRSSTPPSNEQSRYERRQIQLRLDHEASLPHFQFEHQIADEERRIIEEDQNDTCRVQAGAEYGELAYRNVKERWVEQGIWNDKWNNFASGRWKHEEVDLDPASETDSVFESLSGSSSLVQLPLNVNRYKKDRETESAQVQIQQEHERQASKPYYQFIYQLSKERERIRKTSLSKEAIGAGALDSNILAYNSVKKIWTERGIWNKRWNILPGMAWKHEEPLGEEITDAAALQTQIGPSPAMMDGSALTHLLDDALTSLEEANYGQLSSLTASSQEPS